MTDQRRVKRYEWQDLLLRVKCLPSVKLVGLVAATYSDPEGGSIFPGTKRLTLDTGLSDKAVRKALGWLRDNGLMLRTFEGSKRGRAGGKADAYVLTVPSDISVLPIIPEHRYSEPVISTGTPVLSSGTPVLSSVSPVLSSGTPVLSSVSPVLSTAHPPIEQSKEQSRDQSINQGPDGIQEIQEIRKATAPDSDNSPGVEDQALINVVRSVLVELPGGEDLKAHAGDMGDSDDYCREVADKILGRSSEPVRNEVSFIRKALAAGAKEFLPSRNEAQNIGMNDPNYWKYSREEEDHPGLHDRDYWLGEPYDDPDTHDRDYWHKPKDVPARRGRYTSTEDFLSSYKARRTA